MKRVGGEAEGPSVRLFRPSLTWRQSTTAKQHDNGPPRCGARTVNELDTVETVSLFFFCLFIVHLLFIVKSFLFFHS